MKNMEMNSTTEVVVTFTKEELLQILLEKLNITEGESRIEDIQETLHDYGSHSYDIFAGIRIINKTKN